MKRILSVLLLIVVSFFSCHYASAEIDLTSLSFQELVELRDQITDEMITRDEWEGVLIPAGAYEIGVDIPEGTWTIFPEPYSDPYVNIGNGINETLTDFADGCVEWAYLVGEFNSHFNSSRRTFVTWKFSKGHYFIADGPTIWKKAIRHSLGFYDNEGN